MGTIALITGALTASIHSIQIATKLLSTESLTSMTSKKIASTFQNTTMTSTGSTGTISVLTSSMVMILPKTSPYSSSLHPFLTATKMLSTESITSLLPKTSKERATTRKNIRKTSTGSNGTISVSTSESD